MTKVVKELGSYGKEFLARLTGDKDAALAAKNERKGRSAIELQIASLKAKEVNDEAALENAEEAFEKAIYPAYEIENGNSYSEGIVVCDTKLKEAKQSLEETQESIKFWQNILQTRFN